MEGEEEGVVVEEVEDAVEDVAEDAEEGGERTTDEETLADMVVKIMEETIILVTSNKDMGIMGKLVMGSNKDMLNSRDMASSKDMASNKVMASSRGMGNSKYTDNNKDMDSSISNKLTPRRPSSNSIAISG